MDNIKAFINKAKENETLMKKLDALGEKDAGVDQIIALAAENGFIITANEIEEYKSGILADREKYGKLSEKELASVVGGGLPTENRYNPKICSQYGKVHYYCVGFLELVNCDHFRQSFSNGGWRIDLECAMGYYNYCVVKDKHSSGGGSLA